MKILMSLLLLGLLSAGTVVHVTQAAEDLSEKAWITLDQDTYELLQGISPAVKSQSMRPVVNGLKVNGKPVHDSIHVVQVDVALLDDLSRRVHEVEHHCAGYIQHSSLASAQASLKPQKAAVAVTRPAYDITHRSEVEPMLQLMAANNIKQTIISLADFQNRYYDSVYGAQSSDWLANQWLGMVSGRTDISVEQTSYGSYAQSSVVLTIAGNELANQVLVLGAHLDSINHNDRNGQPHVAARAPGADDDASGVATLTEVLRVLVAANYHPQRTIKLIAYAAEEVGLVGSGYIAADHASSGVNVVGVLQLDMTNYQGSASDIYLVADYTDSQQNSYLDVLAAAYLPALDVAYTTCGYACSDHASWTGQGYVASFPFEATLDQSDPYIHSSQDTFANSGGQATHALKFARLALAYTVELADITGGKVDTGNAVALQNDVPVTELSGSQGSEAIYTLDVPLGATDLQFTIDSGSGDADIYVRFGAAPDTGSYDCRPHVAGNTEECLIDGPQAGTWYVMIHGYENYSGVTLEGSYKTGDGACPVTKGDYSGGLGKTGAECEPATTSSGSGSIGIVMLACLLGFCALRRRCASESSHP